MALIDTLQHSVEDYRGETQPGPLGGESYNGLVAALRRAHCVDHVVHRRPHGRRG